MTEVLIFDIGRAVFDWSAAVIEALALIAPGHSLDAAAFAYASNLSNGFGEPSWDRAAAVDSAPGALTGPDVPASRGPGCSAGA